MRHAVLVATFIVASTLRTLPAATTSAAAQAEAQQSRGDAAPAAAHEHAVPRTEQERRQLVIHLAVDHSLQEAARANGGQFTLEYNMHMAWRGRARDLQELVRASPLVVSGVLRNGTPKLAPNGRMINTYYEVSTTDSLKGVASSSVIIVKVPGGRITFPDGSIAEVSTPKFDIQLWNKYVLFLRAAPTGVGTDPTDAREGVYVLAAGPQGVVDVTTGRVKSLALADVPVHGQHEGTDATAFMQSTRALAIAADQARPR